MRKADRAAERNGVHDEAEDSQDGITELHDRPASEISSVKPDWLWPNRLLMATVSIVQGDKGVGKSTWLRTIAAHVTGGPPLPGTGKRKRAPGNVLYYAGEESLQNRVKPGLKAAGADLDRVFCADIHGDDQVQLQLPNDCERLERRIIERGALLVVIDPVFSFSDGTCDLEGPTLPARRFMKELDRVAAKTGALLILTRNLTKNRSGGALASGRGSAELGNAARSVLHFSRLPNADIFGLAVAACNSGRPVPTLTYRIEDKDGAAIIKIEGESDISADDMSAGEEGDLDRFLLEKAKKLIRALIPEGRLDSKTVKQKADDEGISVRTLLTAAKAIHVRHKREGSGASTKSFWLPPLGGWK